MRVYVINLGDFLAGGGEEWDLQRWSWYLRLAFCYSRINIDRKESKLQRCAFAIKQWRVEWTIAGTSLRFNAR